jgi:hypothetical protein
VSGPRGAPLWVCLRVAEFVYCYGGGGSRLWPRSGRDAAMVAFLVLVIGSVADQHRSSVLSCVWTGEVLFMGHIVLK